MKVGEKIKKYLDENNISQTELSINTGIALPKLNLMLSGKRRLPLSEYEIICWVLKLPVGSFLEAKKPNFLN